jgi:hypothetical protein
MTMRSDVQVLKIVICRNADKGCAHKTQSGRTLHWTLCKRELRAPACPFREKGVHIVLFFPVLEHINDVHGCKHWVANPKELVWATHTFARLESIKYSAINKCRITSNIVLYLIKLFLPYYCYYFVSIIFGWLNLTCKYWVLFLKISILVLLNHFFMLSNGL